MHTSKYESVPDLMSLKYGNLSQQLKVAADYVINNTFEVATQSMRTVSKASGLSPSTFTRLAYALNLESFEIIKEYCREDVAKRSLSISEKANNLQIQNNSTSELLLHSAKASVKNIEDLLSNLSVNKLDEATQLIEKANKVTIVGSQSSFGIAKYFGYLAGWLVKSLDVNDNENSIGISLADMNKGDVLIVITKQPFSTSTISTVQLAHKQGLKVINITDSHSCPIINLAKVNFILQTDSPHFFASYVPTVMLLETIVEMLVSRSGETGKKRIAKIEKNNYALNKYWKEKN